MEKQKQVFVMEDIPHHDEIKKALEARKVVVMKGSAMGKTTSLVDMDAMTQTNTDTDTVDLPITPVRGMGRRFLSSAAAALALASSSLQNALANDEGDRRFMRIEPKAPPKPVSHKVYYSNERLYDWRFTHGFSGAKLARKAREGTVGLARLK